MFRALLSVGLLYAAYRVGVQHAQINEQDYLLKRIINLSGGVAAEEYLQIVNGNIQFVQDINLATPLLFAHAKDLQRIIRRHEPAAVLSLETFNNQLITPTQTV